MSTSGQAHPSSTRDPNLGLLIAMLTLSLAGHLASLLVLPASVSRTAPSRTMEMEIYVPPEPPKEEEAPEEPPKPLIKEIVKPPQVKVAEKKQPKEEAPPPPNVEPPPEAPSKPQPIVIGISLDSTTTAGGFATQVGNTAYGKASNKITDPSQVKAYAAPKYVPPGGADTEPVILGEVKIPYPDDAKKNEIEGSVRLKVTLNPEGLVTEVSVISGPGYGLNEAARDAMRKFRFKPATKGGEAVGYTFVYTYTFLLD